MLFSFTFRLKQTQSSVMCHVILKVIAQTYSPRVLWTVTVFLSFLPTRPPSDLFSFLFLPPSYYQLPISCNALPHLCNFYLWSLSNILDSHSGHIAPGLKIPLFVYIFTQLQTCLTGIPQNITLSLLNS